MKLRCSGCLNLLLRRTTPAELGVKCRRCNVWQTVPAEGRPGETVRCAGRHPRPTSREPSRRCNAILLVRRASHSFVIRCHRCGIDRSYPERSAILLDRVSESAVGLQA